MLASGFNKNKFMDNLLISLATIFIISILIPNLGYKFISFFFTGTIPIINITISPTISIILCILLVVLIIFSIVINIAIEKITNKYLSLLLIKYIKHSKKKLKFN